MAKTTDTRYFGDPREARKRRRLFERIERLEAEIQIAAGSIDLRRRLLAEDVDKQLERLDNRLKKPLYRQEMALATAEEAAAEQLRLRLPGIQKKQRLAYRKKRQDLRRQERLLDARGRLLPEKALSASSQAALDQLEAAQQQEIKDLETRLLQQAKASRLGPEQHQAALARYEAGMADKEKRLKELAGRLNRQQEARMTAFTNKQQEKIRRFESSLKGYQEALLKSEQTAQHHLPEDIVLRLEGLSMAFGGLKAVDNLSFDVKKGEIFGLIGPNGAGKTTVFNCITQFYKPTAGDIYYRTHEGNVLSLNNYDVHQIIRKGIVRTFQNVELIYELTILENLLIAAHSKYHGSFFSQLMNTRRVREEEMVLRNQAMEVLSYCGLAHLKDIPPLGLPYGFLKRVELARTLMAGANLIILDEPAAGLNEQETIELTQLIRKIQKDFGATIFLVEHNMGLVMDLCDHICAISFGKKLAYGTPREIQNDKLVQEAYLGTSDESELEVI